MKLDDKRKVIEVLLCCGQDPDCYTETTGDTARSIEASPPVHVDALRRERFDTRPARPNVRIPVTRGSVQRPRMTPMDAPFDREDTQ